LVENVLRFSSAARGADPLSIENVAVGPIVRETIQAFEPLARAERNTVELRLESAAPDAPVADPEGANGCADANALRRILLNLLDNAVKYGPSGQTVTVAIRETASHVTMTVDDQGPGIPDGERDRIFVPFRRLAREDSSAIAGSGVGLSIVRDLADRMGGKAGVETAPGGGARFVVELPAGTSR
jgi:signal transduction histidine kinase